MKCPGCKSVLVQDGEKRFETLTEHCCNPNAIPPYRPVWVCQNMKCLVGGFFDRWGDRYGNNGDKFYYALDSDAEEVHKMTESMIEWRKNNDEVRTTEGSYDGHDNTTRRE